MSLWQWDLKKESCFGCHASDFTAISINKLTQCTLCELKFCGKVFIETSRCFKLLVNVISFLVVIELRFEVPRSVVFLNYGFT